MDIKYKYKRVKLNYYGKYAYPFTPLNTAVPPPQLLHYIK